MWIDLCQCLTVQLREGSGFPPGAQRTGGDRLGDGDVRTAGQGTARPPGVQRGELQGGDVMLPWMPHSSAPMWGASKATMPGEH